MWLLLEIALAHLAARPRQTVVCLLGVTLGVAFTIAMAALLQGSQTEFIAKIIDYSPHIVMRDEFRSPPRQPAEQAFPGGAVELRGLKPKDEVRGIRDPHARVAALSRLPGVVATPALRLQVLLRYGAKEVSADFIGIEPATERKVSRIEADMYAGTFDSLYGVANGIIVGRGLARKLGADLGSTLSAVSPTGVRMSVKVVGLFHTGIVALDDRQTFVLLKRAQVMRERTDAINEIRLRLDDVNNARALAAAIEAQHGYRTESWQESNEGILEVFVIRNIIILTVVGAILVVACFGIFNVISTVVFEKARDIAILISLGFQAADIRRIFLLQGVCLGIVGALLGWGAGFAMTQGLGMIRFNAEMYVELRGFVLEYALSHYLISGAVALASATIAALVPADRAAKMRPVDTLRGAA